MCGVLIFEDTTDQIHLCDGAQLWNLCAVTAEMADGAAQDAQAWLRATGPPIRPGATPAG
jgi:hypothetical protein